MSSVSKWAIGFAVALCFVIPGTTKADTISDQQAQIQALLAQIAALQAELAALEHQTPPPADTPELGTYIGYLNNRQFIRTEDLTEAEALANCKKNEAANPGSSVRCTWDGDEIYDSGRKDTFCGLTKHYLTVGARDRDTEGEVSGLQEFLKAHGFYTGDITGEFDAQTEAAVAAFQASKGIPQTGTVGPLTRAQMGWWCREVHANPNAFITVNSITSSTENPTVTGTARGLNTVGFTVSDGDKVYGSGSIEVVSGNWSHKVSTDLPDGTYTLSVGTYDFGFEDGRVFATGRLVVDTAGTTALGTYVGYLDGRRFIRTEGITEAEALANCKQNAADNPGKSIRCTWKGEEIYNSDKLGMGAGPYSNLASAIAALPITLGDIIVRGIQHLF